MLTLNVLSCMVDNVGSCMVDTTVDIMVEKSGKVVVWRYKRERGTDLVMT